MISPPYKNICALIPKFQEAQLFLLSADPGGTELAHALYEFPHRFDQLPFNTEPEEADARSFIFHWLVAPNHR